MKIRLAIVFAMLASMASVAHAISFSLVNASVPFTSGLIGSNGLFVQTPSHFLLGAGTKSATLTYRVTASTGNYLTSVKLDPNGATRGLSTVSISAVHPSSTTATFAQSTSALTDLGDSTTALAGTFNQFDVTMTVDLIGTSNSGALAKVSVMQVFYNEAPVPEPAGLTALALGGLMILRRKGAK